MSDFLIITGLSGAGRTQAANTMEDLGWFVIDNLPPSLISKVGDLARMKGSTIENVALVVGRDLVGAGALRPEIDHLRHTGARVRVLFLEASDEVLVRRYEGSRRRHPLGDDEGQADLRVSELIAQERQLLQSVKDLADIVVDTSDLNVHQLHDRLLDLFAGDDDAGRGLQTSIVSFGYKHGLPLDVDLVFDCRFLPNPHWVDELRPLSGLDAAVKSYVLEQPATAEFLEKLGDLLGLLLPSYVKEGKSYLSIGVGCTGGHHRSVVLAEAIADLLRDRGFSPAVVHRDIEK
jgi:UPF0042 nucleotide-binding protein